jgi:hypothetical protein
MFTGLLRIGFRNIHVVIHHQTENFTVGMPTDLAFKFAARQAIFAFLEGRRGEGWWGAESMADYCARQSTRDDPFNWIKWYSRSARSANAELGMKGRDRILAHLRKELMAERANAHSARN